MIIDHSDEDVGFPLRADLLGAGSEPLQPARAVTALTTGRNPVLAPRLRPDFYHCGGIGSVAASLLPGLLAATRTGLSPVGDDELTNTKKHHGTTSRCHLPLCWAHERLRLTRCHVDRWIVTAR
jgi:hypothetical protein